MSLHHSLYSSFALASITYLWSANLFKSPIHIPVGWSVAYVNQSLDSLAISTDLMSHIAHKLQLNWNGLLFLRCNNMRVSCPRFRFMLFAERASYQCVNIILYTYFFVHRCAFLIEIEKSFGMHIDNKMSVFFHYNDGNLFMPFA